MTDYGNIESIVRAFCVKRGIDPDAPGMIPCPDGQPGCCVAHYGPAWKRYESIVRDGLAIIEALADQTGDNS